MGFKKLFDDVGGEGLPVLISPRATTRSATPDDRSRPLAAPREARGGEYLLGLRAGPKAQAVGVDSGEPEHTHEEGEPEHTHDGG